MRIKRVVQSAVLALCVSAVSPAFAKMQQKPVEWQIDGATYSGVLVYDDEGDARRPGVVMVPNWPASTRTASARFRGWASPEGSAGRWPATSAEIHPRMAWIYCSSSMNA